MMADPKIIGKAIYFAANSYEYGCVPKTVATNP
jgi:hypothetical protein